MTSRTYYLNLSIRILVTAIIKSPFVTISVVVALVSSIYAMVISVILEETDEVIYFLYYVRSLQQGLNS